MIGEEKKVSLTVKLIVFAAFILLLIVMNMATDGKFLEPSNLKTIAVNASVPTFTAWAFVFIFASGFIDLSLGAVIVLAANVAGTFGNQFGFVLDRGTRTYHGVRGDFFVLFRAKAGDGTSCS